MPVGLVVMKWDERVGTDIIAKYPQEVAIADKTLMQVYSTHEYSGESGMISLMVGSLNIASYYTGSETAYYIMLLLSLEEDPDTYEGGLADISRQLIQYIESESFLEMIPSIFQRLSVYPTLNDEQRLAITYEDDIKRLILIRLRDEGVVSKSELSVWLKDRYTSGFVDIDAVLIDLIKRELVKEASVKGMPSELIFLTKDIVMLRAPAEKIVDNPTGCGLPQQLVETYLAESKKFFQNYKPSDEDNLTIIRAMVNPQVYETLRLLRMAVVTRNDLEKLKKKGVEDIDGVLKILWETQLIQVLQDERSNEYYALQSDFYLDTMFPKYLLRVIKTGYDQKSKADQVLVEYLNVLENTYMDIKHPAKIEE